MKGTHVADLNELACGYVINGEAWFDEDARKQFDTKIKLVSTADAVRACSRGKVMGERLRAEWLANTGKPLKFEHLFWCARNPQQILPTCSTNHPADLLLHLPGGAWLGVSAKSRDAGNIASGLKNPGLGPISDRLTLNLPALVQESDVFISAERPELLNVNYTVRKRLIRADPTLQALTRGEGARVAGRVRDAILSAVAGCPQATLETFVRDLLDCGPGTYPPYVRLVGFGDGRSVAFGATIFDPWKIQLDGTLTAQAVGDQAVGFKNNYERICKLRVKWESEPFASTLKFSVDEWEN